MPYSPKENRLFAEICNGYGFVEISQEPDGIYCTGCCSVHKRPTKIYQNTGDKREKLCKYQVIRLYEGGIDAS